MNHKKEKYAFGFFQDGMTIKIAQLVSTNDEILIQNLAEKVLSYPLYHKETPKKAKETEALEEEIKIPEISEYGETEQMEGGEEEEEFSGKSELQEFLLIFPLDEGKIALNANDEQVSYYQFDANFGTSKLRKRLKLEILSKEELKSKESSLDYIINPDGSILAFVHRGRFELLDALQEINFILTKKKYFYSYIDTNEISLMNLVRSNYDFPPEDYILILYIGVDYKVGIVMKDKGYIETFPIIVTSSKPESMRQAIWSKIMLEQDVANIPITQHIILAGEYVTDEDIAFFQEKCAGTSTVNRLRLKYIDTVEGKDKELSPEKIAQYAIPISLAWKTLDPRNKDFFPTNILPADIKEHQKVLKVDWHGFLVLFAIFYFALTGTIRHQKLGQKIIEAKVQNHNIEMELRQSRKVIERLKQVKSKISSLQKNVEKVTSLTGNKNQWYYILDAFAKSLFANPVSWINNLKAGDNDFQIFGFTTQKKNIIYFSNLLPNGKIQKVSKVEFQEIPVWEFNMNFSYPNPEDIAKEKSLALSENKTGETLEESYNSTIERSTAPTKNDNTAITNYYYEIVRTTYLSGDVKNAYEKFHQFVIQYPNHPLAYNASYLSGECLYLMGKISKAKTIFENTLTQGGNKTPDALMMLGNCCEREHNWNEALAYWKRLVNNFPNNSLARIAANKIKAMEK